MPHQNLLVKVSLLVCCVSPGDPIDSVINSKSIPCRCTIYINAQSRVVSASAGQQRLPNLPGGLVLWHIDAFSRLA